MVFECSLTSDKIHFITGIISRYNCRYRNIYDGISDLGEHILLFSELLNV